MIANIIKKLASNLSREEQSELELWARETEELNAWVKGIQSPNRKVLTQAVDFQFVMLYNRILESDTAAVTINIPSIYRNVVIMGSGSITSANGGNVWAQFNSDTGNNYTWQFIKGDNTTISGSQDTSDPYVALGVFGTTGAGAGVNGSFRAEIIHCQGAWKKNVLSHCYTAEFNDLYLLGSTWQNTSPIRTIEIFGTDNTLAKGTTNIASGSLFTVYGML